MIKINLRKYYSFIYPRDMYIDVPDEIAVILKQMNRMEHAKNERRRIHRAYYSLDSDDGIERNTVIVINSPQAAGLKSMRL